MARCNIAVTYGVMGWLAVISRAGSSRTAWPWYRNVVPGFVIGGLTSWIARMMSKNAQNRVFKAFCITISPNVFIRKEEFDLCREGRPIEACDEHHGGGCSFGIE
jgi:hypothetical protein